ncbi:MAG: PilC/PilY family type IV pilus protein [Gammaproteobacteria bacterium]|nr:PilC/PilY family type IV pilus protein [Gammaproteobacteria bacterium]
MEFTMQINNIVLRKCVTLLLVGSAAGWGYGVRADVAQTPLFLTTAVKPNVMLMLDNSGSMRDPLIITASTAPYDSGIVYLSNCSQNPMPVNDIGRTQVNKNKQECKKTKGLSWSNGKCYSNAPVEINYDGTSIPDIFSGQLSGNKKTVGNQCFADLPYKTSLPPNDVISQSQIANYLNWYYLNKQVASQSSTQGPQRMEVAKNAATILVDSLVDQVRLGLATFNNDKGGQLLEVVGDLDTNKRNNVISTINSLSPTGYTPLAETLAGIGNYFSTGSNNLVLEAGTNNTLSKAVIDVLPNGLVNKTSESPLVAPIQNSCQRSFTIFVTDGLPTRDQNIAPILQDYDKDCAVGSGVVCTGSFDMKDVYPYPGGNGGSPNKKYGAGDSSSDYLDDVAQALYKADLRPDLRDPLIESKEAKNNLTTFVIGFADEGLLQNPLAQDAARQGGGKFYFAGDETRLTASLANAFSIIIEQAASSSSVATNSTHYQTNSLIYQAIFDSNNWSGDLIAYSLTTEDANGNGVLDTGEDANNNGKLDAGAIGAKLWQSAANMPMAADRAIYSYNPLAVSDKGIKFLWPSLNASQQAVIGSQAVLDFLRGDQSQELNNNGIFRNRAHPLGDIVNSDPLYVAHQNLGYSQLPGAEGASYNAFVATTRTEMLYVAANDGMLHGFDASVGTNGGVEQFAYLPNSVITPNLVSLADPNYAHKYIADGSLQSGDVYYNSAWHTALVGSLGAGGKALFALDVTDPDNFSEVNVLWEFTDADLGYTLPEASIVRLSNGQWAAVVANGYFSVSGKATLYLLDIKTGAIIKKLDADTAGGNGLSSPVVVDADSDSIADYVYAGDLKGNLWKFDISGGEASWGVANGGSALFSAVDATGVAQPITSKPAASKAKADGQSTGTMVYFGTGKYFESGDNVVSSSSQVQTFYGIWDKCDKSSGTCSGIVSGRSDLQQQTIIYEGISGITTLADGSTINGDVRVASDCEVAYGSNPPTTMTSPCTTDTNRRGWYLDLLSPSGVQGERVVSTPVIRHGVVIFPTVIPTTQTCTPGGTSWLMELDQFSGARLTGTPIDINEDGVVDDNDYVKIDGTDITYAVSGIKSTVGIIDTPAIINCENGLDCKYATGSSGNMMMVKEAAPKAMPPRVGARTSWQQLFAD